MENDAKLRYSGYDGDRLVFIVERVVDEQVGGQVVVAAYDYVQEPRLQGETQHADDAHRHEAGAMICNDMSNPDSG